MSLNLKLKTNNFSRFFTTTILGAALAPLGAKAKEEITQLPTVSVIESNSNEKYNSTESSYYKLSGPLLNRPQTVTTVTRQVMDDQGVTTMKDALRNAPGVSIAAGEAGNQGDNLTIRGFSARNDFFIDGMRDFGSYYRDPFNLESIEVVQGPSSILFGRGSTGGVIEQNTKQAFLGSEQKGSVMLGTNATKRATADVNSKISGLNGAAFRLNAMVNDNKVANRDYAEYSRYGFAPNLSFGLGTDTRLNLSYFHQSENDIPDYGVPWLRGKPANVNRSNFYGFKSDDYLKAKADVVSAKFEHDLDENSTFRNQIRHARYERQFQITEPQVNGIIPYTAPLDSLSVTRNMIAGNSVETYFGDQADITTKFATAGIDHKMIVGAAIESESSTPTRYTYSGVASSGLVEPNVDAGFNPTSVAIRSSTRGKINTISAYAMDTIKFNHQWEMLVGARFDRLKSTFSQNVPTIAGASRTDNLVSHNVGLVYKPLANGSVYINHGTSFNPTTENFTFTTTGSGAIANNLAPEKNTIYELGTKWELLKKRLSTAFAIFRSDKENARETSATTSFVTLSGSQRVYGFQAQISGNITDNWKIIAGYTYMDGRVVKAAVNPAQLHRSLQNVPEHSFNIFTTYKLPSYLEIGGGANFVGERAASSTAVDPNTGAVRTVPSYLTFNAMAKYPLNKRIEMQLNINNIFNSLYYDQIHPSHVVPSEGRVILLSANIKF